VVTTVAAIINAIEMRATIDAPRGNTFLAASLIFFTRVAGAAANITTPLRF